MRTTLEEFLLNVRVADGLDVLVLTVVIYAVWRWLQRRAPRGVAVILICLGLVYILSRALNMYLTTAVFQAGLTVLLFAIVVIFQEDLRTAVERLAFWRPFSSRNVHEPHLRCLDELVEAVNLLAGERTGALIILPGRQPLDRHIRSGTPVDGRISIDLLHSIFHSASRGHDGGVIVRKGRIDRLGVHLPLSTNLAALGSRGTRHAAALGLSERTDAQVIVVSEERGTITLARDSELVEVNAAELEQKLIELFEQDSTPQRRSTSPSKRIRMMAVQAGSLAVAVLLWYLFAFRIETVQRTIDNVPVELRSIPQVWAVDSTSPEAVQLTLVGPERAFATFDRASVTVAIDLSDASAGELAIPIRDEHLNLPKGVSLRRARPDTLRFELQPQTEQNIPVKVVTRGELPADLELVSVSPNPDTVTVRVSPQRSTRDVSLMTDPLDLSTVTTTKVISLPVRFPRGVEPAAGTDREIRVRIAVRPASSSRSAATD